MDDTLGKASILAIGTELTTGQVVNRNASWLSEKLVDLGVTPLFHETVADDRAMIRNALDRCANLSQFIFITGGLGPTTDDFTREVIAEWLGNPLEFKEEVWQQIVDRLTDLGVPVAESNRQQAFFPAGSQIIPNPKGTAAGFSAAFAHSSNHGSKNSAKVSPKSAKSAKILWVFPGPPNEVSAVWKNGVETQLKELFSDREPIRLLTWQCMGKSEAELGEITEKALQGSGLLTGYRAHRPFVEIKVWCPESQQKEKQPWIASLEAALSPWIITRQGEDLISRFFFNLDQKFTREKKPSIQIFDRATGGILAFRLEEALRRTAHPQLVESIRLTTEWTQNLLPEALLETWIKNALEQNGTSSGITLALAGFTETGKGALGIRDGSCSKWEFFELPYRRIELLERMKSYAVEMALKRWAELILSSTSTPGSSTPS